MRVFTIIVAAAFGLAAILMFMDGRLGYILARSFHLPVLLGGIALIVLAALRAVALRWDAHVNESGWQPSRLIVLAFPIGIVLIDLPNSGFSQERIRRMLGADDAFTVREVNAMNDAETITSVRELLAASVDPERRERLAGTVAVLEGRMNRFDDRRFTLFRLRMTCCAADASPVKVRIIVKRGTLSGLQEFDWIRAKGRIQFVESPKGERLTPVVVVEAIDDIQRIPPGQEYDE